MSIAFGPSASIAEVGAPPGRTFYVRQTSGDDRNDGSSPEQAWRSIGRLSGALEAGDSAYVGPGLHRDQLVLRHSGTPDRPIRIIADPFGVHTHDSPGTVMITGAEPIDERIFEPHGPPGVFKARFTSFAPVGVVEMDGPQARYKRARSTREHLVDGLGELEVIAALPSTYAYDAASQVLYIHTGDGAPPAEHEIELIRRRTGISVANRHFIVIGGFTIRHTADAGILFSEGSRHGIAIDNVCWGHRIGIRVNGAIDVLLSGNVLFRNENSGVYFLRGARQGRALENVLYENIKGVRFGSRSDYGQAIGNLSFRNREAGISVEDSLEIEVMGNRLIDNADAQLMFWKSREPRSEGNCFEASSAQATARVDDVRHADLPAYREAAGQDRASRAGACGPLPEKVDVRQLHAEAQRGVGQGATLEASAR